jgi:hypothetical protein
LFEQELEVKYLIFVCLNFVFSDKLVPLLTESIVGPLTQAPTEEQKILKQQQIKAKGVSRGPSKLLSKFMPEEHRKVKNCFLFFFNLI